MFGTKSTSEVDRLRAELKRVEADLADVRKQRRQAEAQARMLRDQADLRNRSWTSANSAADYERAVVQAREADEAVRAAWARERELSDRPAELRGQIDRLGRGWTPPAAPVPVAWPDDRLPAEEKLDALDALQGRLQRRLDRAQTRYSELQRSADAARQFRADLEPGVGLARFEDAEADARAAFLERDLVSRALQCCRQELRMLDAAVPV